tara:strand:+ start:59 stop:475 length:417 start_codon:yes stop_codon:yes gene_type:complete
LSDTRKDENGFSSILLVDISNLFWYHIFINLVELPTMHRGEDIMLTIEKRNDDAVEVWHYESDTNHSVRVCTRSDKLAATLPRDVLVMVRKLVNELDRVLPKEPVLQWTADLDDASLDSALLAGTGSSPAADDRLKCV